jgi:thioredoxin-like negative regulator of GroEL
MVNDIRFKRLEKARFAGLSRDFATAYTILNVLIAQDADDVEARRLYGNLKEMEAFGDDELAKTNRMLKSARSQYRHILKIDPGNLYALFDLADQMVHFGRVRCATKLYEAFLLRHREEAPLGYDDEVAEAKAWVAQSVQR